MNVLMEVDHEKIVSSCLTLNDNIQELFKCHSKATATPDAAITIPKLDLQKPITSINEIDTEESAFELKVTITITMASISITFKLVPTSQ